MSEIDKAFLRLMGGLIIGDLILLAAYLGSHIK